MKTLRLWHRRGAFSAWRAGLVGCWLHLALAAQAQAPLPPDTLPATVQQALREAQVPASALAVVVADATAPGTVWVQHHSRHPVNPASTLKLVTTYAALDTLGPAHVWRTRVWTDGDVRDGVLHGHLYLQGSGDPKLVTERLWLLLQRVRTQLGVARIAGDLVLDRSAYRLPAGDPGAFDNEPLRPYNATPDALLINHKSQVFTFTPDPAQGVARIDLQPALAGVSPPTSVPLDPGPCDNWREQLQARLDNARAPRFLGRYPSACGERQWPVAHPEPEAFAGRAVLGMWQALGGHIDGHVRDGRVPPQAQERLVWESPPLAEIVRDVNKFSNNVMAQHVLLALGQASLDDPSQGVDWPSAQRALLQWWARRLGPDLPLPVVDNGAGLSRDARISADALARLLQLAYTSALMPELMASLPASGWDGTLRRQTQQRGLAHLKTGSLRDVQALAGYVHGQQGQRRVLVAIVNHPNARAARPALEALVQWAAGW